MYSRLCWRGLPRHRSNLLPALLHPDFKSVPDMPGTSQKLYQSESAAGSDASGAENRSTSKQGEYVSSAPCQQTRSFQVVAVLVLCRLELAAGLQYFFRVGDMHRFLWKDYGKSPASQLFAVMPDGNQPL